MSTLGDVSPRPTHLGRYELITQIGQGGMAEVQLAIQRGPAGFEKLVVVKLVHENLATQKAFVDMLLDEARVAALVKHPNVVDIYDLGEAEGRYFIAMEYLEGEPLLAVLRAGREGKRLDPLSTGRLIADTAEGLDAAHELRTMGGDLIELVHHDVSLGNIVVLYNGQVKLVDFGVAKASQSQSTRAKVQGKFSYMAPEKLRGGAGDRRSDIWSLGCVLWEALTLRRLFKGGNDTETMRQVLETEIGLPSKVNSEVPPEFDRIVMRALDRDPDKRYPTAKEMAADLEEVLREQKYGGKNDLIAKYMQTTFENHIGARKKLLQQVSSKGRASTDVLEAAFDEPTLASGSSVNPPGEFAVKFRRAGEVDGLGAPEGTPTRLSDRLRPITDPNLRLGVEVPRPPPDDVVIHDPGPYPRASSIDLSKWAYQPRDTPSPDEAPPPAGGGTTANAREKRTRMVAIGGGALLVTIAIVLASRAGGSKPVTGAGSASLLGAGADTTRRAPKAPSVAVIGQGSSAVAELGSQAAGDAPIAGSNEGAGSGEPGASKHPVANGAGAVRPPIRRVTIEPKPERADAEALFQAGLQAYVRDDPRTAVASFKRAVSANPSFAPTWRALGHAYEKLGEKAQAKTAFQRYLQLSPNASDGAQVRARMAVL